MRTVLALACVTVPALVWACTSGSSSYTPNPDGGTGDDSGVFSGDGGIPDTERCAEAGAICLSGTASAKGFVLIPRRMEVLVYDRFPSGGLQPVAKTAVAKDGTWAVPGLAAGTHYYVQGAADFGAKGSDGGATAAAANYVGPVTVPSSGPVAVVVEPVSFVLEESSGSSGYAVQVVQGHVFDPASGVEVTDGGVTVSLNVGGTSTPIPYDPAHGAYYWQFSSPPAAQATYTLTATGGGFADASPASWTLTAATPTFTPAITAPASGSTFPAGQPLAVQWTPQPTADYVQVELYRQSMGQWTAAYGTSPALDSPDGGSATIPASATSPAGSYLLNVDFTTGNCPSAGGGCVLSTLAASAQLTAQ